MAALTVQDGKLVVRDGKVGTEQACCCEQLLCLPCGLPRTLSATIEGFPDGYFWRSVSGGSPPNGGGFSPNCGQDPTGPNYRVVGAAGGSPAYTSVRLSDYNSTFTVTYDESSDECCPQWYGEVRLETVSGPSGQPAAACGEDTADGFTVSLCKESAFVNLQIVSNGQGAGATAEVTQITNGAISGTQITNAGSGYAHPEVVRIEPTVTAAISSATGSGASLTVTIAETTDLNNEAVWAVTAVTVSQAGSGYDALDFIQFSVPGGEEQSAAFASLKLNRQEPTLGLTLPFAQGTGATFSLSLTETTDSNGEAVWQVDSVSVTNGGSGYSVFGEFAQVDLIDGQEQAAASFIVYNKRLEPTVTIDMPFSSAGTGAVLTATLSQTTDFSGRPAWEVASVSVSNGGTGYESFDFVEFSSSDTVASTASASLTVSGGVIQSVTVSSGGLYYIDTDEIEEVAVISGGEYYKTDGSIASVVVNDGGEYYQEQQTGNAVVDTVVVSVISNTGYDADIDVVIDDDLNSATFGEITALTINDGGEKYAQQEDAWVLNFGTSISPLAGATGLALSPQEVLCEGADQGGSVQPAAGRSALVSEDPCAETLLSKTYDAFFRTEIFPNFLAGMPNNAGHSLSGQFFCTTLRVVDWGGGQLKVTIAPL